MRVFVALPLPEEQKIRLQALVEMLRETGKLRGRAVRMENYHITLAFIGDVTLGCARTIAKKLESLEEKHFSFDFDELGVFRSGILWMGLKEKEELLVYAQKVRDLLVSLDISFDQKAFKPHITIVRGWRGREPGGVRTLMPPMLPRTPEAVLPRLYVTEFSENHTVEYRIFKMA